MAAPSSPSMIVELRISCRGLPSLDALSKSDPLCLVFDEPAHRLLGQTECIKDCSSPEFVTAIKIQYYFERVQRLSFHVLDSDSTDHKKHDFIGQLDITLAEILGSVGGQVRKPLLPLPGKKAVAASLGEISVIALEVLSNMDDDVVFSLRGVKLDKKDFLGKSDPYYRLRTGPQKVKIFESEIIRNTLNPVWKTTTLSLWALCNGDLARPLLVEVFDWDAHTSHDLIGVATVAVADLLKPGFSFELVNPKKQKKSGYRNSGEIVVDRAVIEHKHTFIQFITGGCEINFNLAIDFTGSNGAVHLPSSLHYQNPYAPNDYIRVIQAVGNILSYYDTDKLFPVFGFGGKMADATNGNPSNPYCVGVPGIIQAYQQAITHVALWGPTNFAPVIKQVSRFASAADHAMSAPDGRQTYFVLLIITDGIITDHAETQHVIVEASSLPLSIIIVGVGNADFSQMNILDGDGGTLRSPISGRAASRDIVQFVPFNQMGGDQEKLTNEVLAEVPAQVVSYFLSKGIQPKAAQL